MGGDRSPYSPAENVPVPVTVPNGMGAPAPPGHVSDVAKVIQWDTADEIKTDPKDRKERIPASIVSNIQKIHDNLMTASAKTHNSIGEGILEIYKLKKLCPQEFVGELEAFWDVEFKTGYDSQCWYVPTIMRKWEEMVEGVENADPNLRMLKTAIRDVMQKDLEATERRAAELKRIEAAAPGETRAEDTQQTHASEPTSEEQSGMGNKREEADVAMKDPAVKISAMESVYANVKAIRNNMEELISWMCDPVNEKHKSMVEAIAFIQKQLSAMRREFDKMPLLESVDEPTLNPRLKEMNSKIDALKDYVKDLTDWLDELESRKPWEAS